MAIPFSLETSTRGGVSQLALAGDVDIACADELTARAMDAINTASAETLVLDLAQVTFMDSNGIGTLFRIHTACAESGKQMVLRAVPRYVRDVLKITGLDLVISIEDSNAAPDG
ncbi:MAG: hypothetical protein QOG98_2501 [Pseudonocardiales bacterium]|nr:hypothetical protein [Pseudonocardiales bacterium]